MEYNQDPNQNNNHTQQGYESYHFQQPSYAPQEGARRTTEVMLMI
ncbi:MAG: hypothetical protein ACOX3W_02305 [Christensenellaceae bacterium]|jgi:hypothetical protein